MREVRQTVEVPASARVEVSYTCEEPGCGFETANEREARVHHGRAHVRGERIIGNNRKSVAESLGIAATISTNASAAA